MYSCKTDGRKCLEENPCIPICNSMAIVFNHIHPYQTKQNKTQDWCRDVWSSQILWRLIRIHIGPHIILLCTYLKVQSNLSIVLTSLFTFATWFRSSGPILLFPHSEPHWTPSIFGQQLLSYAKPTPKIWEGGRRRIKSAHQLLMQGFWLWKTPAFLAERERLAENAAERGLQKQPEIS